MSDCGSRAVEFVLCVQNEKDLQGANQFRMGPVSVLVKLVQHVEEVLDVAYVLGWGVVLSADPVSVGIRGEGWYVA